MNTTDSDRTIVTVRRIAAPRALVFEAWTQPHHVDRWMGPDGFRTTTQSMDFRPGGEWLYTMAHEQYGTFPNRVRYIEVVPGERLVYDHDSGEEAEKAGGPPAFRTTVTFTTDGDGTVVTMRAVWPTAADCEAVKQYGAVEGGMQTLARLDQALVEDSGDDLVITRTLAARREVVWSAWTEAERLAAWWGPKGFGMRVAKLDLRPGGMFHYAMSGPAGTPMAGESWGRFVYEDVQPPERICFVNSFSDAAGGITRHPMAPTWPLEVHNTLTLTESGGTTTLTLRGRPIRATDEERATFTRFRPNVQAGFGGTFDQLVAYLAGAVTQP